MKNLRWANPEHIGICYDGGDAVVYLDSGTLFDSILSGQHGPIGEPVVIETPAPPATADQVRSQRDSLLAASDWTQVADAPVNKLAWSTYRKALRDIPSQEGFPHSVVWPKKP